MSHRNKTLLSLSGGILFLVLLIAAKLSWAQTNNGQSPAEAYQLTWAYLLGSLAAIFYKSTIGVFKHVTRRIFSWWSLLIPLVTSIILSVPTILYALPNFGPPSGKFLADFLYSFAVVYSIHDVTADCYKLYIYIDNKIEEKSRERAERKKAG